MVKLILYATNTDPFQEQSSYIVVPPSKKQWKNKSKNINVLSSLPIS